jgi:hypothetical protein
MVRSRSGLFDPVNYFNSSTGTITMRNQLNAGNLALGRQSNSNNLQLKTYSLQLIARRRGRSLTPK